MFLIDWTNENGHPCFWMQKETKLKDLDHVTSGGLWKKRPYGRLQHSWWTIHTKYKDFGNGSREIQSPFCCSRPSRHRETIQGSRYTNTTCRVYQNRPFSRFQSCSSRIFNILDQAYCQKKVDTLHRYQTTCRRSRDSWHSRRRGFKTRKASLWAPWRWKILGKNYFKLYKILNENVCHAHIPISLYEFWERATCWYSEDVRGRQHYCWHWRFWQILQVALWEIKLKPRKYDFFRLFDTELSTDAISMFHLCQKKYTNNLRKLGQDDFFQTFHSEREKLFWLSYTRPDLCCMINRAAQVTENRFDEKNHYGV